eukprot:gene11273-4086_t
MSAETETENFIKSDENLFFKIIETSKTEIKFNIETDFEFILKIKDEGKFEISSEEFLDDWVISMNNYCSEGKKTVQEVLLQATQEYKELISSAEDIIYITE